jgi:hypothetical protein
MDQRSKTWTTTKSQGILYCTHGLSAGDVVDDIIFSTYANRNAHTNNIRQLQLGDRGRSAIQLHGRRVFQTTGYNLNNYKLSKPKHTRFRDVVMTSIAPMPTRRRLRISSQTTMWRVWKQEILRVLFSTDLHRHLLLLIKQGFPQRPFCLVHPPLHQLLYSKGKSRGRSCSNNW